MSKLNIQKWMLASILVCTAISFLTLLFSGCVSSSKEQMVAAEEIILKTGPGDDFAEEMKIGEGETLTVIEETGRWIKVQTEDNREGWVARGIIENMNEANVLVEETVLSPVNVDGSSTIMDDQISSGLNLRAENIQVGTFENTPLQAGAQKATFSSNGRFAIFLNNLRNLMVHDNEISETTMVFGGFVHKYELTDNEEAILAISINNYAAVNRTVSGFEYDLVSGEITYTEDEFPLECPVRWTVNNGTYDLEKIDVSSFNGHEAGGLLFWSSDQTKVAIRSGIGMNPPQIKVYDYNSDIMDTIPVIDPEYPTWSPDSKKLSFSYNGDLYIYDVVEKSLNMLGVGGNSAFSPDGKVIVFDVMEDDGYRIIASELFIANTDGTGRRQITDTDDVLEIEPFWASDGKYIYFENEQTGRICSLKVGE